MTYLERHTGDKNSECEKNGKPRQEQETPHSGEEDRAVLAELRKLLAKFSPETAECASPVSEPEPPPPFARILCPVDFTESSQRAFALAGKIAAHNRAVLYLLHVHEPLSFQMTPEASREAEEAARRQLRVLAAALAGNTEYRLKVVTGDAANKIIEIEQEIDADLIVAGRRAHGAFSHFLLEGVTDHLLRESHCPVLITRAN
ncbi:MAG: universal stress protein [Candidatus Binataceae bacterium]